MKKSDPHGAELPRGITFDWTRSQYRVRVYRFGEARHAGFFLTLTEAEAALEEIRKPPKPNPAQLWLLGQL